MLPMRPIASRSQTEANRWIRSPDETTSTPSRANQLNCARVDARHVRNRTPRRIFHRDASQPLASSGRDRPRADRGQRTARGTGQV